MRTEDLLEAIGNVEDELLERSEKVRIKRKYHLSKWLPMVASLGIIAGLGIMMMSGGFEIANDGANMESMQDADAEAMGEPEGDFAPDQEMEMEQPESEAPINGNSDDADEKVEDIYGKSVCSIYSLCAIDGAEQILADRAITLSFPEDMEAPYVHIQDRYILENTSNEEQNITLYYPYDGEVSLLNKDGEEILSEQVDDSLIDSEAGEMIQFKVSIPAESSVEICAIVMRESDKDYQPGNQMTIKLGMISERALKIDNTKIDLEFDRGAEVIGKGMDFKLENGMHTAYLEMKQEIYCIEILWK